MAASTLLTVTGAFLELVGLAFVFVELAIIRSHEFGVDPPMTGLLRRLRRLYVGPKIVEGSATISSTVTSLVLV